MDGVMVPKNTREHFTHQGHPLNELKSETEFLCGGCKTIGNGTRFQCKPCDFNLHEYCVKCPSILTSFMHPHPLTLVVRASQSMRKNERLCDVCGDCVDGLFYKCCEFDVHPLCTQLPQFLTHALHPNHRLMLQQSTPSSCCSVCKGACTFWLYRCGVCCFDIHLECLLPFDSASLRSVSSPSGPLPLLLPPSPPPPGNLAFNMEIETGDISRSLQPPPFLKGNLAPILGIETRDHEVIAKRLQPPPLALSTENETDYLEVIPNKLRPPQPYGYGYEPPYNTYNYINQPPFNTYNYVNQLRPYNMYNYVNQLRPYNMYNDFNYQYQHNTYNNHINYQAEGGAKKMSRRKKMAAVVETLVLGVASSALYAGLIAVL